MWTFSIRCLGTRFPPCVSHDMVLLNSWIRYSPAWACLVLRYLFLDILTSSLVNIPPVSQHAWIWWYASRQALPLRRSRMEGLSTSLNKGLPLRFLFSTLVCANICISSCSAYVNCLASILCFAACLSSTSCSVSCVAPSYTNYYMQHKP